jgi:hypothetical protein
MEKELIFPRDIQASLLKWLDRKEAFAIKGPRQSGKTTLLRIMEQSLVKKGVNTVFLNFEDPDVLEAFEADPKEYVKSFLPEKGRYCFLMDEYHYVKDAGKKLKLLYDTFDNIKFVVTGSSSLELGGAMAKFLVGRVFFFELFPFSFHEFLVAKNPRLARIYEEKNRAVREFMLGNEDKIEKDIFLKELLPLFGEYVTFGGYPAVIKTEDAETKRMILKSIYDTYISKDIVAFLKVTDALKYRHVVRALALLIGNLINYNDLCSTCQVYYKELKRTISILSETYVISLLRPFYKNPITELKKQPKPYFFDLGLRNYIADNFSAMDKRVDAGALVENFVFLSLRNMDDAAVSYWRTIAKAEVDFVLRVRDGIIPVEVKYQHFAEPKVSRSLRSFIMSYKPKRALVATGDFWGRAIVDKTTVLFTPAYYL